MSLQTRLVLAALVTILLSVGLTARVIRTVVFHVVVQNLDVRMDTQLSLLESAIAADGTFHPQGAQFIRDLKGPNSSWGWRVRSAIGGWQGGAAFGDISSSRDELAPHDGAESGVAVALDGSRLHIRRRVRGNVEVDVGAPDRPIAQAVGAAMEPTLLALSILTAALVLAALVQLRLALRPLRAMRRDVAAVRAGRLRLLPAVQPGELAPLVGELNALIERNAAGLDRARNHMANLAHGLKTPLATLALGLAREKVDPKLRAIVNDLDQRIDHHLGRARGVAAPVGARANLAEVTNRLIKAMRRMHRQRRLDIVAETPSGLDVRADPRDLDEMVGNLLDNACKHASRRIAVTARAQGPAVVMTVEDDGPGIAEHEIEAAFRAGVRLDETGRGYGFGLGITLELAELYGGRLHLDRSDSLAGLRATLQLPRI